MTNRFSPYTPVPVLEDVPEELAVYLTEHRADFPDRSSSSAEPCRTYPYGAARRPRPRLRRGHQRRGVRAPVEDSPGAVPARPTRSGRRASSAPTRRSCAGTPGRRVLEVDANGNTIRELGYQPPVAGHDVVLTIDRRVQAVAEQALREELERSRQPAVDERQPQATSPAGSAVVLDPRDGSVVAMASYPDLRPGRLHRRHRRRRVGRAQRPGQLLPAHQPGHPGPVRAGLDLQARSPRYAGLTTRLHHAAVDLRRRAARTDSPHCRGRQLHLPQRRAAGRTDGSTCRGRSPCRATCTSTTSAPASGSTATSTATPSRTPAGLFGMGADTGVPLPNEKAASSRRPRKWRRHEENPTAFPDGSWQAGDNVNMAIGQGDVLVTPIQLANAYATLANGGTALRSPNIALARCSARARGGRRGPTSPASSGHVVLPADWRDPITRRVHRRRERPRRHRPRDLLRLPRGLAGRREDRHRRGRRARPTPPCSSAWRRCRGPQYVAVAFMEESGFGGVAAAPLVRRMFEPLADPMATARGPRCTPSSGPIDAGCPPEAAPRLPPVDPAAQSADPLADGDVGRWISPPDSLLRRQRGITGGGPIATVRRGGSSGSRRRVARLEPGRRLAPPRPRPRRRVAAIGAIGVLMVYSRHPRARWVRAVRHHLPQAPGAVRGLGFGADGCVSAVRLPPRSRLGRRCIYSGVLPRCWPSSCRRSGRSARAPRRGSSSAPSSSSRRSWRRSPSSWGWPRSSPSSADELDLRRLGRRSSSSPACRSG